MSRAARSSALYKESRAELAPLQAQWRLIHRQGACGKMTVANSREDDQKWPSDEEDGSGHAQTQKTPSEQNELSFLCSRPDWTGRVPIGPRWTKIGICLPR
ncbi:unnamed protein product [Durusdinium trenchii]|uniref:Uncharacterized protein n=1 Tax=Durusdinium trenchii TaxID=1381693 RepID=A0ABP0S4H2_9DINO